MRARKRGRRRLIRGAGRFPPFPPRPALHQTNYQEGKADRVAERIPPGFSIPLGFYDGPEVRSIPRRIRAQAVGVWAMAGNYSATRLSDGYVDAETLKELGCGPAIRAALMNTLGHNGQPDPLWIDAPAGGIQFTKWPKWQRTAAEVKAYRESEAERKRAARAAKKPKPEQITDEVHSECIPNALAMQPDQTSNAFAGESSGPAETEKRPADVRRTSGQSESETETEYYNQSPSARHLRNVGDPAAQARGHERGRSDAVDPSASRLVATLIPSNTPAAVKTALRLAASQLMVGDGLSSEVVAEALRRWQSKPDAGPGLLAHIASGVQREATAPAPKSKQRDWAELAREARVAEENNHPTRKAIER